jgi:hypothetical protein
MTFINFTKNLITALFAAPFRVRFDEGVLEREFSIRSESRAPDLIQTFYWRSGTL